MATPELSEEIPDETPVQKAVQPLRRNQKKVVQEKMMSSAISAGQTQGKRKRKEEVIVIVEDMTPQSKARVQKINVKKGTVK